MDEGDQVTVILPSNNGVSSGDINCSRQCDYTIDALRKSSSYFDAMLGGRWLETHDTEGQSDEDGDTGHPVVDLSQTGLNPVACASVLNFMELRFSANNSEETREEVDSLKGEGTMRRHEVTLEEMKVLLWDGFVWDEENAPVDWGGSSSLTGLAERTTEQQEKMNHITSTIHSDEIQLFLAIDYLHLQPYGEILSKIWAMKLVYCPCYLERRH